MNNNINFNNPVNPYENYLMVLNRTKKSNQGVQLLAAKYHMYYNIFDIDLSKFSTNLINFQIGELMIYRIVSDAKWNSLSDEEKKLVVYHTNNERQFVIQTLPLNELFKMSYFNDNVLHIKEIPRSSNILFYYEGIKYPDLLANFKNNNIIIIGGDKGLHHIISPIKYRLSQIVMCMEGGNKEGVNKSYHLDKKIEIFGDRLELDVTKPNIDWKGLNNKNPKKS